MVDLGNGYEVGITQPVDPNLRVGDPVRIEGSGSDASVAFSSVVKPRGGSFRSAAGQ